MHTFTAQLLEFIVQQQALAISRERKLGRYTPEFLDALPSTEDEMLNDLLDARAFVVLKMLEDEIGLGQVDPKAYFLLEGISLRRLKEMKAFFIYKAGGSGSPEGDYNRAAREIRGWLRRRARGSLAEFANVKVYLRTHYLDRHDRLNESSLAVERMITEKARRIRQLTNEPSDKVNWFRAKLYVSMFYENIVGAVVDDDRQKTATILKAFEFSKAPRNRYLITNAFEAAIAIGFLNKDLVDEIGRKPELFDFSMVGVDTWPECRALRSRWNGRFRYDEENKQIIYDGVMAENERDALISELEKEEHKIAVQHLFEQSTFRPYEDMIL